MERLISILHRWLLRLAVLPALGLLMGASCDPIHDLNLTNSQLSFVLSGLDNSYGSYRLQSVEFEVGDAAKSYDIGEVVSNGNNIFLLDIDRLSADDDASMLVRFNVKASVEGEMWRYECEVKHGDVYLPANMSYIYYIKCTFVEPTAIE